MGKSFKKMTLLDLCKLECKNSPMIGNIHYKLKKIKEKINEKNTRRYR
jgi:hypothetical protein